MFFCFGTFFYKKLFFPSFSFLSFFIFFMFFNFLIFQCFTFSFIFHCLHLSYFSFFRFPFFQFCISPYVFFICHFFRCHANSSRLSSPDHLAKNSSVHECETPATQQRHLSRERECFFCDDLYSCLQGRECSILLVLLCHCLQGEVFDVHKLTASVVLYCVAC